MTNALCDESGDDDEQTDLETYTTTIDNEDAVDEYFIFKHCLLSKWNTSWVSKSRLVWY